MTLLRPNSMCNTSLLAERRPLLSQCTTRMLLFSIDSSIPTSMWLFLRARETSTSGVDQLRYIYFRVLLNSEEFTTKFLASSLFSSSQSKPLLGNKSQKNNVVDQPTCYEQIYDGMERCFHGHTQERKKKEIGADSDLACDDGEIESAMEDSQET